MKKLFLIICAFVFLAAAVVLPASGALPRVNTSGALANPPAALPFTKVSKTSITAAWGANGNPAGTGYLCENITSMTDSAVITGASWESGSLTPGTSYSFKVKAINDDGIETAYTDLGSKSTISYIKLNWIETGQGEAISALPTIEFKIIHSVPLTLASCGVLIDGAFVAAGSSAGAGFTAFSYSLTSALSIGRHEIGIKAVDLSGTIYSDSIKNLLVQSGSSLLIGVPLCYPNPYDPASGNANIAYSLSSDAELKIYIFDDTGSVVIKKDFVSGSNGGRSGYNEINWDGKNEAGSSIKNGAYTAALIAGGKIVGKAKIILLRSR